MHYTPLASYSIPKRPVLQAPVRAPMMSAMTAISPVTGELMVPGNAGVVIQADSGKEAIRVSGTAMTANMTLSGHNSTLNQIQFFSNGELVSAFDQQGLYFPNAKGIYFGNAASFGALTYASNETTLSAPTTINLRVGTTNVVSISSAGLIGVRSPVVQAFAVGAVGQIQNYTVPNGISYLHVRMWAGGGAGGWASSQKGASTGVGSNGGNSNLYIGGVSFIQVNGGTATGSYYEGGYGQDGGAHASINAIVLKGGDGMSGTNNNGLGFSGGMGGISFGGSPAVLRSANPASVVGSMSLPLRGSGGSGGNGLTAGWQGGGGGAGGYCEAWIPVNLITGQPVTLIIGVGGAIQTNITSDTQPPTKGGDGYCIIVAHF
jgi:hypothetical protein